MNPDQRNDLKQKFQSWKKKTPEERQRIRTQFEKFRKLPPEEKQRLRASRERFKNLAPERKQKLRERFKNMFPKTGMIFASELKKEGSGWKTIHPKSARKFALDRRTTKQK